MLLRPLFGCHVVLLLKRLTLPSGEALTTNGATFADCLPVLGFHWSPPPRIAVNVLRCRQQIRHKFTKMHKSDHIQRHLNLRQSVSAYASILFLLLYLLFIYSFVYSFIFESVSVRRCLFRIFVSPTLSLCVFNTNIRNSLCQECQSFPETTETVMRC